MHISVKSCHLRSDEHKNKKFKTWCADCSKYISDTTRHFQSEIHPRNKQTNQRNQQNTQSAFGNFSLDTRSTQSDSCTQQSCPSVQSTQSASGVSGTQHPSVQSASGTQHPLVQLIVYENTYNKLKVNLTENLERHINDLLSERYFPRYKYQLSYSAKFSKIVNGEEEVFKRLVKSDLNYNYLDRVTEGASHVLNSIIQKLDDEQLEGSGFVFQQIEEVILEIHKVIDIQASSYIEIPPKYTIICLL